MGTIEVLKEAQAVEPLTDIEVEALAICRRAGLVSVSKVQRVLSIGYNEASEICQSIIDKGQCNELELAPSLKAYSTPCESAEAAPHEPSEREAKLLQEMRYIAGISTGQVKRVADAALASMVAPTPSARTDELALAAAGEIMGVMYGAMPPGGSVQLQAMVQCIVLRAIEAGNQRQTMADDEIEKLAVEHEAFGFGRVDERGLTTHGFDPEGLRAFARAITLSS